MLSVGIAKCGSKSYSSVVTSQATDSADRCHEKSTEVVTTIEFIEAQTRAVEARAALSWIKARVVRDGMKLSDVAILARDLEPYRPFLEEAADEFGIPLRIVGGQPLNENPAVAALMTLLSLPVE